MVANLLARFRARVVVLGALAATTVIPHSGLAQGIDLAEAIATGRMAHLRRWDSLIADSRLTGVERFACFVQIVVDDAYARVTDPNSPLHGLDGKRLLLDDLADLMVSDRYRLEKALVLEFGPASLGRIVAETDADLVSFRPELRAGDGRLRHFAMNAAAAYQLPGFLVDLAARSVGNDVDSGEGLSADSEADLLTNEIGREFAGYLRAHALVALADGVAVKGWILARFSPL